MVGRRAPSNPEPSQGTRLASLIAKAAFERLKRSQAHLAALGGESVGECVLRSAGGAVGARGRHRL